MPVRRLPATAERRPDCNQQRLLVLAERRQDCNQQRLLVLLVLLAATRGPYHAEASPVLKATVPCHAAAGRQGRLVPLVASAQAVQNAGPADAVLALLVLLLHLVSGTQAGQRRPGPRRAD